MIDVFVVVGMIFAFVIIAGAITGSKKPRYDLSPPAPRIGPRLPRIEPRREPVLPPNANIIFHQKKETMAGDKSFIKDHYDAELPGGGIFSYDVDTLPNDGRRIIKSADDLVTLDCPCGDSHEWIHRDSARVCAQHGGMVCDFHSRKLFSNEWFCMDCIAQAARDIQGVTYLGEKIRVRKALLENEQMDLEDRRRLRLEHEEARMLGQQKKLNWLEKQDMDLEKQKIIALEREEQRERERQKYLSE